MGFQKCLLRRSQIGLDDRLHRWPSSASRTPAAWYAPHPDQRRLHTSPPALPRPTRSSAAQMCRGTHSPLLLPPLHIVPHRPLRCRCCWHFLAHPLPDPLGCMPLLSGCLAISFQNPIDKPGHRGQLHRGSFCPSSSAQASRSAPPPAPSAGAPLTSAKIPMIVPTPNSYSRRICSYNSTLVLQVQLPPPDPSSRSNPD